VHTQRWRLTALGQAVAYGRLRKGDETALSKLGEGQLMLVTRWLSERSTGDAGMAKLVQREWRYGHAPVERGHATARARLRGRRAELHRHLRRLGPEPHRRVDHQHGGQRGRQAAAGQGHRSADRRRRTLRQGLRLRAADRRRHPDLATGQKRRLFAELDDQRIGELAPARSVVVAHTRIRGSTGSPGEDKRRQARGVRMARGKGK
jgi:hypothetical protein